jgi:hypothetical protein
MFEKYIFNALDFHQRNYDMYVPTGLTGKELATYVITKCVELFFDGYSYDGKVSKENFLHSIRDYFISYEGCFEWSSTPEGHDVWEKVSNEWREFLRTEAPKLIENIREQ